MKEVRIDGSLPARVQDIATGAVRLPTTTYADREPDVTVEGSRGESSLTTITLEQYRRLNATPATADPSDDAPMPLALPVDLVEPYDSFTIDAEILVERLGQASFTTADLADVLGIAYKSIAKRVERGTLPAARFPADSGTSEQHRWSAAQVVEILARRMRVSDDSLLDAVAGGMTADCEESA